MLFCSFTCSRTFNHVVEWRILSWYNDIVESWAESLAFPFVWGDNMTQKEFYKSRAWKRARQAFIDMRQAIDGGLCEVCGMEPGKIVHHTIWLDDINCNDPDISLNPERFLYECQTCHNKEQDPRKATPGRCLYGKNGEILRNTNY